MKKFAFLILSALLFAGCNNMLTNPDAFNSEDATVSMDISQLKARLATNGVVLTSTLDFVGDEPKHAPFEKTQTINGDKIEYTVKGLPTGSTVQFKLSVMNKSKTVFEGLSNKITIKGGKNALTVSLKQLRDWILYTPSELDIDSDYYVGDVCYHKYGVFNEGYYLLDFNLFDFSNVSLESTAPYKIDIPAPSAVLNSALVYEETDYNGNKYYYNDFTVVKLECPNYKPVKIIENFGKGILKVIIDSENDTLYIFESGYGRYAKIENISSIKSPVENVEMITIPVEIQKNLSLFNETYQEDYFFRIYNNALYYNSYGILNYISLTDSTDSNKLTIYTLKSDKSNSLITESVESGARITDLIVREDGVYALFADQPTSLDFRGYIDDTQRSRGALIKLNHNLEKDSAKIYGFSTSKYKIVFNHLQGEHYYQLAIPKSIKAGFYGPQKFIAVKPKKLVFIDDGAWHYMDEDGLVAHVVEPINDDPYIAANMKNENHIIEFDLETESWTAIETNLKFNNEGSMGSSEYDPYSIEPEKLISAGFVN